MPADPQSSPPAPAERELLEKIQKRAQQGAKTVREERARQAEREKRAARRSIGSVLGSPVAALVLGAAMLLLSALNLTGHGLFQVEVQTFSESQLKEFLAWEVDNIRTYKEELGSLPQTLADLELEEDGPWRYRVMGNENFRLILIENEKEFVHDTTQEGGE